MYGIDDSAAVDVFVSDKGMVSTRVVGVNFGGTPTDAEEDALVQKEHKFCSKMSAIEVDLEDVGIVLRRKKTVPPGREYGTWVQLDQTTVSWSRDADACYNAASISYTAKQAKTSYVSITRKQYVQNVYVKYQDANGNYSGDWALAKSQNLYYGASFEWSYSGDACYNAVSVIKYTVTGAKNHYIYIPRKKYSVSVSAGIGISSVSGSGSYYYGANCTVDAVVKTGYTWKSWSQIMIN